MLLTLCSCGSEDFMTPNEDLGTISQNCTNSGPNAPLSKYIIDDFSSTQISPQSNFYNSILYIGVDSRTAETEYIPVSYIQNGTQQLLGEIAVSDNILLNAPSPELLTGISTNSIYSGNAKSSYISCILYNGAYAAQKVQLDRR